MAGMRAVGGGPLILVADDSRINQQVAQGMLERRGYRAVVASNGREALAALAADAYAAVLLDLVMPELDGYATAAAIRRQEPAGQHLPILAMSATSTEEIRAPCLAAGMDDFIEKPMRLQTLAAILTRWVGTAASRA